MANFKVTPKPLTLPRMQKFFTGYRPDAIGGNFTVVQVTGGGNNQNNPGIEVKSDLRLPIYPD